MKSSVLLLLRYLCVAYAALRQCKRPGASRWQAATVLIAALQLTACGGGGSMNTAWIVSPPVTSGTPPVTTPGTGTSTVPGTSTTVVSTNTTGLPLTGISFPLQANDSVHVPAGTQISAANGTLTALQGGAGSINVRAGAIITVPTYATGPATILLTALSSLPDAITNTLPTVTAIAGSPNAAGPPVDGVGTEARFWGGGHLAMDTAGNILVTESGALKQVSPSGVVVTVSPAYQPYDWQGIAVDAKGTVYGSGTSYAPPPNAYGASIQSLSPSGSLTTVVSNWTASATITTLGRGGLAVDTTGNLYLTDARNHRVLKFSSTGQMSVLAGSGVAGFSDGTGTAAAFNSPSDLSIDSAGNLWVADSQNSAVRKITPTGVVSTVARVDTPSAIAIAADGVIYCATGAKKMLTRVSADLSRAVTYPLPNVSDGLTGLTTDSLGHVYAGTSGVGAQIIKIVF